MGQLYLSYPSVEAYRDFDPLKYHSLDDALVPSGTVKILSQIDLAVSGPVLF